jgi:hypothetical protein
VMLAFVTNSTQTFNLSAEDIIYLNDLGVPGAVVTAMIQRDQVLKTSFALSASSARAQQEPAEPPKPEDSQVPPSGELAASVAAEPGPSYPVEAPLTPEDGSEEMFNDSLSPYGDWVDVQGYGRCWQPTVVVVNRAWQPYFDCGHWVYSDCGWYWASDYSWGWAPFHYGNWFRHARLGWCWRPGRTWGPSWVSWRYNDHSCGWAPLPPGARFSAHAGLTFRGHQVRDNDDFGLRPSHYHFVAWHNFNDHELRRSALPPRQVARAYESSTVATRITGDGRTVINNGLPTSRVAAATLRPIHTVALRDSSTPVTLSGRAERLEAGGHALTVYRPTPALASRTPSRQTGGFRGTITSPDRRAVLPPRSVPGDGNTHRPSNDVVKGNRPSANQTAPLIIRGPQPSGNREAHAANSLVVIGRGNNSQSSAPAEPRIAASFRAQPSLNSANPSARVPSAVSAPSAPSANTVSRPAVPRATVSSSPQPAWFGNRESSGAGRAGSVAPAARPEIHSSPVAPRTPTPQVPRYAPAPAPQRSYSPPAMSTPARSPSVESRPAPAPSAPPARSAPAASSSSGSNSRSSSGRNGR